MSFFATAHTWQPSLNPLDVCSASAALISAAVWFLVDYRLLRRERAKAWLTVVAPMLLLAIVFYSKVHVDPCTFGVAYGWRSWRNPPDAQNYFADYILIAVAFVLAGKATRLGSRDLRVLGFIDVLTTIAFLALESHLLYEDLYAG